MPGQRPHFPRKSPVQGRARATVEAVLEAAAHILEAEGLGGFNTNAVAQRAGVSIGSLYQYFAGKDAVLAALIRREALRFEAALSAALAAAARKPLQAALETLAEATIAHQAPRPRLARLLDLEEQRLGLGQEAADASRASAEALAAFVAGRAELAHLDPDEAAADLLHLARGLIDGALARGATGGLARRVARAALGYLAPEWGC